MLSLIVCLCISSFSYLFMCVCFTKICRYTHTFLLSFSQQLSHSVNQLITYSSTHPFLHRLFLNKTTKIKRRVIIISSPSTWFHLILFLRNIAIHYLLVEILERLYREIRYDLTRLRPRYVPSFSAHSVRRMRKRGEKVCKKECVKNREKVGKKKSESV